MPGNEMVVSVIIPFYNIADSVQYCVKAICEQTYSSLEIICVDDGSTDETSQILDSMASADSRIRVFHNKNGGLSAARNFGISQATGDYITFVDGDDLVSPIYIESLIRGGKIDDVALVYGRAKTISYEWAKREQIDWDNDVTYTVLNERQLYEMFMYEEVLPSAWARLAPRACYDDKWFPVGHIYEEISTIGKLVASGSPHVLINEPIYGYVMRQDSIVHKREVRPSQVRDYITALKAFEEYAYRYVPSTSAAAVFFRSLHYSRIVRLMGKASNVKVSRWRQPACHFLQEIRDNISSLLGDRRVSIGNKIRFIVIAYWPSQYERLIGIYEKYVSRSI